MKNPRPKSASREVWLKFGALIVAIMLFSLLAVPLWQGKVEKKAAPCLLSATA